MQNFDETQLLDRVDNDIGFLAETVDMLATDGPDLLAKLQQAITHGDAPAVGRLAHMLKGMIANFCAADAQATALDMEKMGKSGDLSQALDTLEILTEHTAALTTELQAFVKARS